VVIAALVVNELIGLCGKAVSPSEEAAAAAQTGH
jgi:hypothetical protein